MGLIIPFEADDTGIKYFAIANILQSFLVTHKSIKPEQSDEDEQERFIIVETTFKLTAYTGNPVYKGILELFCHVDY